MKNNIKEFKRLFKKIKNKGFIETKRHGNTGIGKTFEDVCGIVENNVGKPDFRGIEIKSQRNYTGSYITLFTKAPTYPLRVNTLLREKYGSFDVKFPDMKVLHTSVFAKDYNTHKSGFGYKLEVDKKNKKIFLLIKDLKNNKVLEKNIYWSFEVLDYIIENKLKYIAFITAHTKEKNNKEFFHFTKATLLKEFSFNKFIELLLNNLIMFDIRIGVYKSGKNKGRTHDHGSGFRMSKKSLPIAFEIEEI
ncbi:MAG: MvaI/BcnI family restriction endonuclease [Spirochaetia bacterium]|nr:MvaI/BcnI family restriction endonuclease [Spirochaetia bacterium]